jgi:ankyrin repeat protein
MGRSSGAGQLSGPKWLRQTILLTVPSGILLAMRSSLASVLLVLSLGCRNDPQPSPSSPVREPASRIAATTTSVSRPPLIEAIISRQPLASVLAMIASGADVNASYGGMTALHYAVGAQPAYGQSMLPVVQAMVERGADLKARGIGGFAPLHVACQSNRLDVVEYLISKGADVNAKADFRGITPLHVAVCRDDENAPGKEAIMRLLVARGAEINALNEGGETPRDWALWRGDNSLDVLIGELGGRYNMRSPPPIPAP